MILHAKLVHRWFREVWAPGSAGEEVIDELMSADAKFHGIGPAPQSRDDFKQLRRRMLENLEDLKIEPIETIEYGDHVAFSAKLTARHRRSGRPVELTGTVYGRIEDGQFTHAHQTWDFLSMFAQIGEVSEAAVAREFGND